MSYTIRPMAEADLPARAMTHYTAWQETYRGLLPDAVLDAMPPEFIELAARERPIDTLLALEGRQVVGFSCYCGEARPHTGRTGMSEIAAFYLLRRAQGRGLGRRLMEEVLHRLPHRQVVLYVLRENKRAAGFYAHMGFTCTGRLLTQPSQDGPLTELEMLLER